LLPCSPAQKGGWNGEQVLGVSEPRGGSSPPRSNIRLWRARRFRAMTQKDPIPKPPVPPASAFAPSFPSVPTNSHLFFWQPRLLPFLDSCLEIQLIQLPGRESMRLYNWSRHPPSWLSVLDRSPARPIQILIVFTKLPATRPAPRFSGNSGQFHFARRKITSTVALRPSSRALLSTVSCSTFSAKPP